MFSHTSDKINCNMLIENLSIYLVAIFCQNLFICCFCCFQFIASNSKYRMKKKKRILSKAKEKEDVEKEEEKGLTA